MAPGKLKAYYLWEQDILDTHSFIDTDRTYLNCIICGIGIAKYSIGYLITDERSKCNERIMQNILE